MMHKNISMSEVLKLSVAERIQLVEDVWDSIAAIPEAVPLTPGEKEVLDRRLNAYHKNPSEGSPWAEIKKKILFKK